MWEREAQNPTSGDLRWVLDIFLVTKGEEFMLLRNMVGSSGDYHNLYKHIYKDLRELSQVGAVDAFLRGP